MNTAMRVFIYLGIAALGYAAIFGILVLRLLITDTLPDDTQLANFTTVYLGYGLMASIVGTGLGVISFFTRGRTSKIFLALPAAIPVAYSTVVMLYYSI
jgi:hypothetical protein